MEGLTRLVNESLADHGYEPNSITAACNGQSGSAASRASAYCSPLASPASSRWEKKSSPGGAGSKRMLALFHIAETGDISMAMGSLFLPGSLFRERLESGRCFTRYAVIENATERAQAVTALQQWMQSSAELPQVA